MSAIPFPAPPADSAEVLALRSEFRLFLDRLLGHRSPRQRSDNWYGFSRDFSLAMGQAGYLGMTWPKQYGGHERSAFEDDPARPRLLYRARYVERIAGTQGAWREMRTAGI